MADKSSKNWFARHKVLTVILVLVVLGIVGSATGGSKGTTSSSSSSSNGAATTSEGKTYKFNDRADKQPTDVEIAIGESATVDGVKMTPVSATKKNSLSDYDKAGDGKQFLVVNVQLENTDSKTHSFNPYDFKIQTAGGQVLDNSFHSTTNPLTSGDLVAGGKSSGSIVLEVPVETSHQYLIWKPNAFESDRAIVQVQ